MPSMAMLVRRISQKMNLNVKGKDSAESSRGCDPTVGSPDLDTTKLDSVPAPAALTELSRLPSRNSSFGSKNPCPSPHSVVPESPEIGPQCQTTGSFEGMLWTDLCCAMKHDAKCQNGIVDVCAEIIASTVKRNDARKSLTPELTAFEGPAVDVEPDYYVRRVYKYGGCSPCCLAIGCLYLQRLKARYHSIRLSSTSFIRLFAVAVMEASKYFDDNFLSNRQWGDIAGISVQEMNQLELEFLFRIQFDLNVDRPTYNAYVADMLGLECTVSDVSEENDQELKKLTSFSDVTEGAGRF